MKQAVLKLEMKEYRDFDPKEPEESYESKKENLKEQYRDVDPKEQEESYEAKEQYQGRLEVSL